MFIDVTKLQALLQALIELGPRQCLRLKTCLEVAAQCTINAAGMHNPNQVEVRIAFNPQLHGVRINAVGLVAKKPDAYARYLSTGRPSVVHAKPVHASQLGGRHAA